MTTHSRTQIRDAVVALIDDGQSLMSGNVHKSRTWPVDGDIVANLPAALVFTLEETVEVLTVGSPRTLQRDLLLMVEVLANNRDASLDDNLDALCREVEMRLAASPTLSGKAKFCSLQSTAITLKGNAGPNEGGGGTEFGSARMTYRVVYSTLDTTPETLR